MIKRAVWLSAGAAIGAGGMVWARRRLESLSRRVRSGELTGDVVAVLDRRAQGAAHRVRRAVETGREEARRREGQLWRDLEVRARAR